MWIVGSQGMLGSALTALCPNALATTRQDCDITNPAALLDIATRKRPALIINCAAYTDVDKAESEPTLAHAVNALGPAHLAKAARSIGAKLIHISTDYVFDGTTSRPYRETDPTNPINTYGRTKREGEERLLEIDLSALIVRTSWLFGQSGNNFLSKLLNWLQTKEEIGIASDQINKPTYAHDLACALISLQKVSGIVHFANGYPIFRFALVQELLDAARKKGIPLKCKTIHPLVQGDFPSPAKRPLCTPLDTALYTSLIAPPRSWQEVLNDYLEAQCPTNAFL